MLNKVSRLFVSFKKQCNFNSVFGNRKCHSKNLKLPLELEVSFNNQIGMEFYASFTYLAMAAFFGRQNVSLPGFQKFFMDQTLEEREHAQKLIDYLNLRGNNVCIQGIQPPQNQSWESPLAAFKEALELELLVSQKLFELHKISEDFGDVCASILLENEFLENQIEEFDELSRHITELERIGSDGLGIYLYDKRLLKVKKN